MANPRRSHHSSLASISENRDAIQSESEVKTDSSSDDQLWSEHTANGVKYKNLKTLVYSPAKRGNSEPSEITDQIFIGGTMGARLRPSDFLSYLQIFGITHVLHCAESKEFDKAYWTKLFSNTVTYYGFEAMDDEDYDLIGKHWKDCSEFLSQIIITHPTSDGIDSNMSPIAEIDSIVIPDTDAPLSSSLSSSPSLKALKTKWQKITNKTKNNSCVTKPLSTSSVLSSNSNSNGNGTTLDVGNNYKVLICCNAGMNRSVSICVAALVDMLGFSLRDAVTLVIKQRGFGVLWNEGFLKQLISLASHDYSMS